MTFEPCGKIIHATIPGTNVPVDVVCKFARGHVDNHIGKMTVDGIECEVEGT